MTLTLSWDLFILVVFGVVMTYSFILGKNQTLKVIIAAYISILLTQGIGNILSRFGGEYKNTLAFLGIPFVRPVVVTMQVLLFVVAVLFLMLRGGFEIEYGEKHRGVMSVISSLLFGFATAVLIISTLFSFAAGLPVLSTELESSPVLIPLMQGSTLVQVMVRNQDLWFSLPALLIVGFGFLKKRE
jgi:hypothetical protein